MSKLTLAIVAAIGLLVCSSWSRNGGARANSTTPAASSAPKAQKSQQTAPSISGAVERDLSATEKQIVEAADAMPNDKFNFNPQSLNIPGSDYKGVRSFAQQVKHIAAVNYVLWSPLTGDPVPAGIKDPNWRDGPEELKSKAEIIKFLRDSFALGHKALSTLSADNAAEEVPYRIGKAPRLYLATHAVSHADNHYGQLVEYLRMNGIVPPATAGRGK